MQKREFNIAFVGLKPGEHQFQYTIEDKFFVDYGPQDFSNCKAQINLTLEKNTGFMQLKFDVGGTIDVNCDRCGNLLHKNLWDEFTIVVKMVENPDEMNEQEEDPDIFYISRTESHLYVGDWVFEFINLSIPMQNECGEDEEGHSLCNQTVLNQLEQLKVSKENPAIPIWKGLDKFKNLDN